MSNKITFTSLLYPVAIICLAVGNIIIQLTPESFNSLLLLCADMLPSLPSVLLSIVVIAISVRYEIRISWYWWTIVESWIVAVLLVLFVFNIMIFVFAIGIHLFYRLSMLANIERISERVLVILIDPMLHLTLFVAITMIMNRVLYSHVGTFASYFLE